MIPNENDQDEFAALLNDSEEFALPSRGDIREAEILEIRDTEIVVDMGGKRDGIVPTQDVQRLDPKVLKSLHVGDLVPVYILNPNDRDGNLIVSLNLGLQGQDWERARKLLESGDMVEGEIIGYNRGGLLIRFGRLEGFVPASHLVEVPPETSDAERRAAMNALIGQSIGLKVIEVNQGRRRLILSQREAQREWRAQQKKRLLDNLSVGSVITGRVTGIRDFGVFVDLGGADGLIHVSELDWHRVPHPKDVVKVGEEIQVYVLELDRENQRIALSLRRTKSDPWDIVNQNYQLGQIVEGTVSNVVDFGAFVVLPDGIEGLLHVTEMGDGTLSEPRSYVKRGDKVTVRIVRIEPERKRIGFTQRSAEGEDAIEQQEFQNESVEPGDAVPTEPADEPPTEPVEPGDEASIEPADEPPAEPVEPVDEISAEPADEPPAEPVEPVDEISTEPADEPPAEPVDEPDSAAEIDSTADVSPPAEKPAKKTRSKKQAASDEQDATSDES